MIVNIYVLKARHVIRNVQIKRKLTHLPYHANHSQMSIAFAHEAALAMERRSVNYQFLFRQLDRTSIISREGTLTANKSLISICAIHYIVI